MLQESKEFATRGNVIDLAIGIILGLLLISGAMESAAQKRFSKGEPQLQWVLPAIEAPRLEHRVFRSEAAGADVSYEIYTPEIYDTDKRRRFPVLYWLHGSGGGRGGIKPLIKLFGDAIRERKIPPVLVVFPNGLRMGMWCDSKDGRMPIEAILIKELIPNVDSNYRTIPSREGRMIEGFSMGGYGAARLGFKYHRTFGAVSILGAGPLQREFKDTPRAGPRARDWILRVVFGGSQEYFQANSPWILAEQNADSIRGKVRVRQLIGSRDEAVDINQDFHKHLMRLKIPHTFRILDDVSHNPMAILKAMGDSNWEFYRSALGGYSSEETSKEKR